MGDVRARAVLTAFAVVVVGTTARAHADSGVVVVGGTVDATQREAVQKASNDVASELGWTTPATPLTKKETEALVACKDPHLAGCMPTAMKSGALHHVYVVVADPKTSDDGDVEIVLTGRIFGTDPPDSAADGRHCEPCAIDRLTESARDLATALLRHSASESRHTMLAITSVPPGASIMLDGQTIGVTDATYPTFPGKHVVMLQKQGYLIETQTIPVPENQTTEVKVQLRASPSAMPPPATPVREPSRVLGPILVGTGAVFLAGGIVLVAVDQDPSPTEGKKYWNTAPLGFTVGAIGLVAGGIGAYVWYRASRAHAPRTVPTAALVPGGGVVGFGGSF
jgi:hypothetical protein